MSYRSIASTPTYRTIIPYLIPGSMLFRPDSDPETSTFDGAVALNIVAGDTWANLHDATTGSATTDSADYISAYILSDAASNKWEEIDRVILLFDVSDIPSTATIASATLSLYGETKTNTFSALSPTVNIFSANPASNTAIATADYDRLGTTAYCDTAITYANFSTSGYNDFDFNATGLAAITSAIGGDGILKLGYREATYDAPDSDPTANWEASKVICFRCYSADKGVGYEPTMVVEYTNGYRTIVSTPTYRTIS